jgi:hypothetical protein
MILLASQVEWQGFESPHPLLGSTHRRTLPTRPHLAGSCSFDGWDSTPRQPRDPLRGAKAVEHLALEVRTATFGRESFAMVMQSSAGLLLVQ